jgi:hypothetical protein
VHRTSLIAFAASACGGDPDPIDPPACDPDACAADGKLCDGDACVDPWAWGSPAWRTCDGEPRATPESMSAKAAAYDDRALALHAHPAMPWVVDVVIAPGVDPALATTADVVVWRSGENDGLFSGLVLASQAYRYAATRDPAALDALDTLLDGEEQRMRITGVPGLFTRQLIPPDVPGIACPTDPMVYVPAPDKRGNKWVRIGDDGCAQVADPTTLEIASTTHCGLDEFRGWCFLDNVSQDEYVGHLFALGAIARLVDHAPIRDRAVAMLQQIGDHVVANDMEFVDWDGRPTQWGKIHPGAFGDTPGYLAVMGMSFLAVIARATGDPDLRAAYDQIAAPDAYPEYLYEVDLWEGPDGCTSNWNNISMLAANFHHLLWHEHDADRRAVLHAAYDRELIHPSATSRGAIAQHNAWYQIMWAAQKPLGPDTDGPAYDAVDDAICQLRQFPASNHIASRDTTVLAPHACDDRFGLSLADTAFEIADRCAATYAYWGNPYARSACTDDPTLVQQPAGFLLPYWMARYYGMLSADD